MALLANGYRDTLGTVQRFGATAHNNAYPSTLPGNYHRTAAIRNLTAGQSGITTYVGLPSGNRHPSCWMMPQKAGVLAARNTITGSGVVSGSAQSGYNIEASITGSGDITSATLGLIVSIAAALTASGGISSATATALASMVASLTGSGDVTATAAGLADLGAALLGTGTVTAGNTALMDISANIVGYSALTPEGIRDSVWTAILSAYGDTGNAALALQTAGSGGVDYAALWASMPDALKEELAAYVLAAAGVDPIHANIETINTAEVIGDGTEGNAWRGLGVPP